MAPATAGAGGLAIVTANSNSWIIVEPNSNSNNDLDYNKTRNEIGHAFGLLDPPGREWDANGITDDHIKEIVKRNAWPAARCCMAISDAITERLIFDEEDLEWLEQYNKQAGNDDSSGN